MSKTTAEMFMPHEDNSVMQDVSAIEGPSSAEDFGKASWNSFETAFENNLGYKGVTRSYHYAVDKLSSDNKFLTPEEAKNSTYYREGIDVSNGISEYMLKTSAEVMDRNEKQAFWSSQLPDTIKSNVGNYAVEFIANALDPVTDAAFLLAPETIGIKSAALTASVADSPFIVKAITRVPVGAFEGAVLAAPSAAANLINPTGYIQDDKRFARAFDDLKDGMLFGGVVRGFTGYKIPIDEKARLYANQTSVGQVKSGYFPNVDSIIQEGYYQARKQPAQEGDVLENSNEANFFKSDDLTQQDKDFIQPVVNYFSESAASRIKNPQIKKIMGQLGELRSKRNKFESPDNFNKMFDEFKSQNPRLKFKDALKKFSKQFAEQLDELNKPISELEQTLSENEYYQEANRLVENYKQGSLQGDLAQSINERKKFLVDNRPQNLQKFSIFEEGKLTDELNTARQAQSDINSLLPEDIRNDASIQTLPNLVTEIANDIDSNASEPLESTQKYIQNKYPSYVRTAVKTLLTRPEFRSREQAEQLAKIMFTDELKTAEDSLKSVDSRMTNDASDAELLLLEVEKRALKNRIKQLKKYKKQYGNSVYAKQIADASKIKQLDIILALKRNEVFKKMAQNTGEPVDQSKLKMNLSQLMEPSNELSLNQNEKDIFDANAERLDEIDPEKLYDEAAKALENIPEEQRGPLDEYLNTIKSEASKFTKALTEMSSCLLRNA